MARVFFAALFLLLVSTSVIAMPHDVYPVSCDDLWEAVNATLSGSADYRVGTVDTFNMRVSFIVVGHYTTYTQRVALRALNTGCHMKLTFAQIGPENSDERRFMKRVSKLLAKLEAEKLPAPYGSASPAPATQ